MGICVSCRRRERKAPEKRWVPSAGGPAKGAAAELLPRRVHLPAMANSISNIKMTNPIKGIVSKRRKRYMKDGFNLDLAYITDRLIAMGFPAEKLEGVYRNHIDEVYRFLEQMHKDHYKIYNLCVERSYDSKKFHKRVELFAFEDHAPPKIEQIQPFCENVHKWLNEDSRNVAAVHCKAGKGRTGTMVCCYLLYSGQKATADEALKFYGIKRTHDEKGVTIPSQRRYVEYYAALVRSGLPAYRPVRVHIREMSMSPAPALHAQCTLEITVSQADPAFKVSLGSHEVRRHEGGAARVAPAACTPLAGDVRVDVYVCRMMMRKERLFHFWFNTFFVANAVGAAPVPPPSDSPNLETFKLTLDKWQLDDAHKDKQHKLYSPDFKVELIVQKQPESSTFGGHSARAPSPQSSSASSCSEPDTEPDAHWDSGNSTRRNVCTCPNAEDLQDSPQDCKATTCPLDTHCTDLQDVTRNACTCQDKLNVKTITAQSKFSCCNPDNLLTLGTCSADHTIDANLQCPISNADHTRYSLCNCTESCTENCKQSLGQNGSNNGDSPTSRYVEFETIHTCTCPVKSSYGMLINSPSDVSVCSDINERDIKLDSTVCMQSDVFKNYHGNTIQSREHPNSKNHTGPVINTHQRNNDTHHTNSTQSQSDKYKHCQCKLCVQQKIPTNGNSQTHTNKDIKQNIVADRLPQISRLEPETHKTKIDIRDASKYRIQSKLEKDHISSELNTCQCTICVELKGDPSIPDQKVRKSESFNERLTSNNGPSQVSRMRASDRSITSNYNQKCRRSDNLFCHRKKEYADGTSSSEKTKNRTSTDSSKCDDLSSDQPIYSVKMNISDNPGYGDIGQYKLDYPIEMYPRNPNYPPKDLDPITPVYPVDTDMYPEKHLYEDACVYPDESPEFPVDSNNDVGKTEENVKKVKKCKDPLSKPRLSLGDMRASWREFSGKFGENRKKKHRDDCQ